jgi:uroporphyrinogen decarboxylase
MDSKERVLISLNHQEPDRVPIHFWFTPEVTNKLISCLRISNKKEFYDRYYDIEAYDLEVELEHDCLMIVRGILTCYEAVFEPEHKIGDNLYTSDWGILFKKVPHHEGGVYAEFYEHPLAGDKNKLDSYITPDPNDNKIYDLPRKLIKKYGKTHAIIGCVGCGVFEASWYLRGMNQFLIDIIEDKDYANALLDKTMKYHLEVGKKLIDMGIDVIMLGDDIGMQTGMLISPKIFREMLKPRYGFMINEFRKINNSIKVAFHNDGAVEEVMPDFIEIGVDIFNPIQPECVNPSEVKKKYGEKVSFWGTVDMQHVMPFGSNKEVINEVRERIRTVAPKGGLILCSSHFLQPGARDLDNLFTFYWAARKYGNYPIKA